MTQTEKEKKIAQLNKELQRAMAAKDVDLNWPQPFRARLLYSVVGIIAIVLTK